LGEKQPFPEARRHYWGEGWLQNELVKRRCTRQPNNWLGRNKGENSMLLISGIWADVMRMGVQEDNGRDDAEMWISHQKEIEFVFGVLAGLGLARRGSTADNGSVVWLPSNRMKQIHRFSRLHYDYRRVRDEHLQNVVARRGEEERKI
jgi:hypothetical protein